MGFGLLIAGQPFGATVIIGIMIVLGANTNDAVLLIESAERFVNDGMPVRQATREAALLRLRPRLMTSLLVVLSFVPLAFAREQGRELLRPMAAAAIGGLLVEILVSFPCSTPGSAAIRLHQPSKPKRTKGKLSMKKIQILGTGCPKCKKLAEAAEAAAKELQLDYELEKVTDINDIMAFGVMMTPSLAVNGDVKVVGKLPTIEEIKELLNQ